MYQHIPRALYAVRCAERVTGLGKVLAAGWFRGKYNPARQAGTGSHTDRVRTGGVSTVLRAREGRKHRFCTEWLEDVSPRDVQAGSWGIR